MRSTLIIVAALALLGTYGCAEKNKGIETAKEPAANDTSLVDSGAYSTDTGANPYESTDAYGAPTEDKYTYSDTNAPLNASNPKPMPVESGGHSGGGRTYVVRKGDTLYKIAREHYGDQSRWRSIYEANRNQMSDPQRLMVGQTLTLP